MKKIIRHFKIFVSASLYYIWTFLHKKDKKLWVFGEWKGNSYCDNARYLYEYVLEYEKDIRAIWITKNIVIYNKLKAENKPVLIYPSKEAKSVIYRAKFHFQTEGSRDIGYFPVGGATVIQLWHGTGPKSNKWWENTPKWKQFFINIECDNHSRSIWVSTSEFFKKNVSQFFNIPCKNFINTGLPRCDGAFRKKIKNEFIMKLKLKYKYVCVYLPTHRNWGKDFDENFLIKGLTELDEKFCGNNIYCLYKPHPNEIDRIKGWNLSLKNILIVDSTMTQFQDIYEYVYDCDLLVSDYSSIIYDFLCVNKPILLFDYDEQNYKENDGGILDDYYKWQVGPIVYSWKDLANEAVRLLYNDDQWSEKRIKGYFHFNTFSDGNSCQKIVQCIKDKSRGEKWGDFNKNRI